MGQHSLGGLFRHMGGKKMRGEGWPERGVQRDSVPAASPTGPSNQSALHQRWELAFSGKKASWDGDSNMLPGQDFTTRQEWETHWAGSTGNYSIKYFEEDVSSLFSLGKRDLDSFRFSHRLYLNTVKCILHWFLPKMETSPKHKWCVCLCVWVQ